MDDRQESKLDAIAQDISDIKITLVKQEENIAHHIYRTDLAEKNIEALRTDLKPVETHVKHVEGGLKVLGILSVVATIAAGVVKVIQFLH